jgi:acyl-CoA thioesterase YciA
VAAPRGYNRGMSDPVRLPEGKEPVLRVVPMPADVNVHGDVFGGWIMAQVDLAGGVAAMQRARGRVATVAVNAFQFKQPVYMGDLLSFYADVVRVGNTSLTIKVEVYAQRSPVDVEVVKVTEATLTYVATDDHRRPRPVPPAVAG